MITDRGPIIGLRLRSRPILLITLLSAVTIANNYSELPLLSGAPIFTTSTKRTLRGAFIIYLKGGL